LTTAFSTIVSGLISSKFSGGVALEIDQFWQCLQLKLQPNVPSHRLIEPGRK